MKKFILLLSVLALMAGGCEKKQSKPEAKPVVATATPTPDAKTTSTPGGEVVVVWPDGKARSVRSEHITPKSTEYTGEGITYERWVYGNRNVSPFGVSPGELMARQNPASIATGTTPTININPDGVNVGASTEGKFIGGSARYSWLDGLITGAKDLGFGAILFIGVGLILLLILPVIFPMLAPIFQKIWDGITWFFTTILIPWIGAIANWVKVHLLTKAATQIVAGGDAFQAAIAADTQLPQNVKDYVLDLYNKSHLMAHDESTNKLVKKLRKPATP